MNFASVGEIEAWLEPYASIAFEATGKDITLDRTRVFAEHVQNPQDKLKVVHIAGTSGKTSTSYYIAALLSATGKKTGLTVSPHIDSLTERVQINGAPLNASVFCDYFSEFSDYVLSAPVRPSYFELMMVFAYWVFAEKEFVDYAVIETGLGGKEDSSNVAQRPDKVCVIADIGMDHVKILGDTLGQISSQKAGIIWPDNHVFVYKQSDDVMESITVRGTTVGATMHVIEPEATNEYQQRNWQLASTCVTYMCDRDQLTLTGDASRNTQQLYIPARMDIVHYRGKTVVFDGAHNEQKMSAFLSSLEHKFPGTSKAFLVAFKQSKDVDESLAMLSRAARSMIFSGFSGHQDMAQSFVDPEELAGKVSALHVEAIDDNLSAFDRLLSQEVDLYVVTGSFYLISDLRAKLTLNE